MQKNVGDTERKVRVGLGLVVLSLVFWGPKSKWGLLGLLFIVEGLLGWCVLYELFGISTRQSRWDRVKAKLG